MISFVSGGLLAAYIIIVLRNLYKQDLLLLHDLSFGR
jgi:hypothetical protein